ncbi:MAG TPA: STAS domain-containing protein [Terracidiphilus sp.]|jgi:anti-anti-sigma regulatory factor|nr:STAS domain-containing protein [Terracidiphilus sp.]
MLRINISETDETMRIRLEGRITGPWAEELDRVGAEAASRLGRKKLAIDLSDVTYADESGKKVLSRIVAQTGAELIAGTLSTQDLARQVIGKK